MVASSDRTCPIWGPEYRADIRYDSSRISHVISERTGGLYRITREAELQTPDLTVSQRARLTTWIVNQRILGVAGPKITGDIVSSITNTRPCPVYERAERLLKYVSDITPRVGDRVSISVRDNPSALAWSESTQHSELDYLLDFLVRKGWLTGRMYSGGYYKVTITVEGYSWLAERLVGSDGTQAFVAMWFSEATDKAYYEGIEPGIRAAGYTPLRIDHKPDLDKIDDEIIAEIRRSRFLVADFTHGEEGARGGVYFEAGFAHGLGIPVIYTCKSDMIDDVHFDTRQYAHILWESVSTLRHELKNRIIARLDVGPIYKDA